MSDSSKLLAASGAASVGVGGPLPKSGSRAISESISESRTSYVEPAVCSLDSVENIEDANDMLGGGKLGRAVVGAPGMSTGPAVTVEAGGGFVGLEVPVLSRLDRIAVAALAALMAAAIVLNGGGFNCRR